MKTIYLIALLFFAVPQLSAQHQHRKVKKYLRLADLEMYNNNFQQALELYKSAYNIDTANAKVAFKLGTCMYSIRKYKQQSLSYFEKAHTGGIADADYYLGNLYHLSGKFDDAIRVFQNYKSYKDASRLGTFSPPPVGGELEGAVDLLIDKSKTAIELMQTPVNVTIENIGNVINSEYPDYVPVISADESVLIFTSRRTGSTGNLLDPFEEYFEDIYISTKKNGAWTWPKNISANINTPTHDACVGLSADGELLFLYRTGRDLISGDLYSSIFDGKDWTVPKKLPAPVNTPEFTEPSVSVSADGHTLYFSSNRPGGYGKKDIYKMIKLANGEWSNAFNLGASVNTAEDEDAPFIHPDCKTLYFSSQGHKNMGGYDIFKTKLGAAGVWSAPENLGYPVNTPDDDIYFVISTDKKTGYFSSDREGGYGGADIYLIHFPEPEPEVTVRKGIVVSIVSADEEKPLDATITLYGENNTLQGIYNTNELTGKFVLVIAPNTDYTMYVNAKGCVLYSEKLYATDKEEVKKIILHKAEK